MVSGWKASIKNVALLGEVFVGRKMLCAKPSVCLHVKVNGSCVCVFTALVALTSTKGQVSNLSTTQLSNLRQTVFFAPSCYREWKEFDDELDVQTS